MAVYAIRLALAFVVGFAVGIISARDDRNKSSRDFALICLCSALLSIMAGGVIESMEIPPTGDPLRLPAQIISALGFLGTGMMWVSRENQVQGITRAASLWLTAILGLLIGAGFLTTSLIGLIFLVLIYLISPPIERYLINFRRWLIRHRGTKTG